MYAPGRADGSVIFWKITLSQEAPQFGSNNSLWLIHGEARKLILQTDKSLQKQPSHWSESSAAIREAFPTAQTVESFSVKDAHPGMTGTSVSKVGFVLRGPDFERGSNSKIENAMVYIRTSGVQGEPSRKCVYGLLSWTLLREVETILEESVAILCQAFGRQNVRQVFLCANPDVFRERYQIWATVVRHVKFSVTELVVWPKMLQSVAVWSRKLFHKNTQ